jgi:flagellar basal-body rod protein FlgB
MVEGTGAVTSKVGAAVLDLLLLRHRVIANNIANEASQDFKPLRLEFESLLGTIHGTLSGAAAPGQLEDVLGSMASQIRVVPTGEDSVRLDQEMADLAKNTLQYQSLLAAMEKLAALERLGITGE